MISLAFVVVSRVGCPRITGVDNMSNIFLFQEAWLNYRDQNGEKKSEHVVANDREEDFTVPNQMRVIYDFQKV